MDRVKLAMANILNKIAMAVVQLVSAVLTGSVTALSILLIAIPRIVKQKAAKESQSMGSNTEIKHLKMTKVSLYFGGGATILSVIYLVMQGVQVCSYLKLGLAVFSVLSFIVQVIGIVLTGRYMYTELDPNAI